MYSDVYTCGYVLPAPHELESPMDLQCFRVPSLEALTTLPGELLEQVIKTKPVVGGTEVMITRYVLLE